MSIGISERKESRVDREPIKKGVTLPRRPVNQEKPDKEQEKNGKS